MINTDQKYRLKDKPQHNWPLSMLLVFVFLIMGFFESIVDILVGGL